VERCNTANWCTSKVVAWLPSLAGRRGGKNNGSLASSALIQPQPVQS